MDSDSKFGRLEEDEMYSIIVDSKAAHGARVYKYISIGFYFCNRFKLGPNSAGEKYLNELSVEIKLWFEIRKIFKRA